MADDVYLIDVEVHFAHGDPIVEQLIDGRDSIAITDAEIRIAIQPDPDERITYIAHQDQVNYIRSSRRKLEPEVKPGWE